MTRMTRNSGDMICNSSNPTGHTLLVLNATQSYHREVAKSVDEPERHDAVAKSRPETQHPRPKSGGTSNVRWTWVLRPAAYLPLLNTATASI